MGEQMIKCKELSAKLVGSNVVCFRLEDETLLKVHVDIQRIGRAVDRKNPDGTPIYNFTIANRVEMQTKDRIFYAPIPPVPTQSTKEQKNGAGVV
jgi:hypothetical protein